jgi:hypothetical protein
VTRLNIRQEISRVHRHHISQRAPLYLPPYNGSVVYSIDLSYVNSNLCTFSVKIFWHHISQRCIYFLKYITDQLFTQLTSVPLIQTLINTFCVNTCIFWLVIDLPMFASQTQLRHKTKDLHRHHISQLCIYSLTTIYINGSVVYLVDLSSVNSKFYTFCVNTHVSCD